MCTTATNSASPFLSQQQVTSTKTSKSQVNKLSFQTNKKTHSLTIKVHLPPVYLHFIGQTNRRKREKKYKK